ncbi:MAG: class II glutamine amidotransferase, partial [Candidatus Pacearchaeota archaeon]
MCGLISIISKKNNGFSEKELKIFSEGLFTDTVRGKDSTGVFSVSDIGNAYTMKDNTSGDVFIKTQEFEDFLTNAYLSSRIMVGHNRSATLGNVSAKNAHPFISGNTVLVHNGTLFNHKTLANTETDSEAITQALEQNTFNKILPTLDGAFALIWYNAKEKQLYVTRNDQRPLWIIQTKDFDLLGSEPRMLEWILHRNTNIDPTAYYFKPHTVYIWDLNNLKDSYTKTIEFEKKKPIQSFFPFLQQTPTTTAIIGSTS